MSAEAIDRINAALEGRYRVERKIGEGGMATVFLADDLRHERKVLKPELAAVVGAERFLTEIKTTAGLQHPHILPLYDSGRAVVPPRGRGKRRRDGSDGEAFLFYVMPYVPGESLRDRLTREKQLPLDDALAIGREVADALSFAHSQGIVHRDIKPENILLEAGHAVVADFGIARAVNAAGGDRLTETGIAVGTPSYMSPEQAAGSGDLDGRSDVYALACVVYEMLAGQPPFTGPTVESVVHQHLVATPPPVTGIRAAVPQEVADGLSRALAKTPADRFATAHEFGAALESAATVSVAGRPRGLRVSPRTLVGGGIVVALALAAYVFWPRPAAPVDTSVVAVLPFRVVSAEPGLGYLREGMVDLLAAKLTGEGGPRAVDPRTAIRAWERAGGSSGEDLAEDQAIAVGRRVGAGEVLLGSVVGTADRVELHARLVGVTDGALRGQHEVVGSPDSLPWLVDALTARLLARRAGETEQRLVQLTSTSLPALRAYLEGQVAYRRGQYGEAAARFVAALEADSTFALAALGLVAAKYWTTGGFDRQGTRLSWEHRERLSVRDRALVEAIAAPAVTGRQQLDGLARATELAPDRPEPWYWLGESYFHFGPALEIPSPDARAGEAFGRALLLDPSFTAAAEHLIDLVAAQGDVAAVERLATDHLAVDSTGDLADYVRWKRAAVTGDSVGLARLLARLDRLTTQSLRAITGEAVLRGTALRFADQAAAELVRRAAPPSERFVTLHRMRTFELNRGRPAQARAVTHLLGEVAPGPGFAAVLVTLDGLFGGGDTSTAGARADLQRFSESAPPLPASASACALELWNVSRGTFDGVPRTIERLRDAPGRDPEQAAADPQLVFIGRVCTATLDALLAAHRDGPDRDAALLRLDSLMRQGPIGPYEVASAANLTAAHLHEQQGNLEAALAAVRRRVHHYGAYESTHRREEGRLAALLGDRETAIRAYEHYLTLRSDPEPAVAAEVEEVRRELARLIGERGS